MKLGGRIANVKSELWSNMLTSIEISGMKSALRYRDYFREAHQKDLFISPRIFPTDGLTPDSSGWDP